jgi:hypothetical protein
MGIYRTYFDKNNTIVQNSFVNTGRNQVSELYFGDKVSRFLFYCSFEEIIKKVNDKEIILNGDVKHYLKIKNTSNFDISPFLSDSNNLVFTDKFRSSSFDLELKPIKEFWDEGMGYDFELSPLSRPQDRDFNEEPSNWFNGTYIDSFLTPGATLGDAISTQHFDLGNEDVYMDITDFVNDIVANGVITEVTTGITTGVTTGITTGVTTGITTGVTTGTTYSYAGFCLKYNDQYEGLTFDDDRSYVLGLFTRHTQTFFEPFIETHYNDYIIDDRVDFYLNKNNRLYLYVNIDGKLTNLDELPTCSIQGVNELIVKQQTKGVYYVEVFALDVIFDSYVEYNDVWSNIKINGINRPDVKLKFIPKEDINYYQIGSDVSEPIRYGVSLSGIKREEKINQGEKRRVNVHLRKPYTVGEHDVVTNIFYKLYIKQGNNMVEILDWQPVNKLYNSNTFNIDTTWLVPQVYYIDIKIERGGEVNIYNEELKFTVLNKLKA